jgi:hypothetical protein
MKQRFDRHYGPEGHAKESRYLLNSHINKVIDKPEVKEVWLKQGPFPH